MEKTNIPNHIAIIMDGNRRCARERKIDYRLGHKEGAKTLEKIVRYSKKVGIKYITVYLNMYYIFVTLFYLSVIF